MFGSYAYSPSGANWTFYGAGITGNANAFTAGNPIAPNGVQTAFIQMQGYMTQSVFLNPGTYTISFKASQRGNGNSGTQLLRVLVNGVLVGSYQPPTTSYIGYETSPFVISGGGTHVLRIEGKGNGGIDFTAFVDDVQIRPVTAFRGFTDQGFINAKWRTNYNDPTLGSGSNAILYGTCLFPLDNCPLPGTPPLPGIWPSSNSFQVGLSSFSESRFWLLVMNNEPIYETSCNTGPPDQSMAHASPPAVFGAVPVMDTGAGESFYRAHLVMNMGTAPACAKDKIPYMSIGAHSNRGNASASGTQYALAALNSTAGVPHSVGFTARLYQYLTPTRTPSNPEDKRPAGLWFRFLALAFWPSADGSKQIPRMIFVNLFHDNYSDSSTFGPQIMKWNYPMLANSWYNGAEVVYFDAEHVLTLCGFDVRSISPNDIGAEIRYDIDLHALFSCAGKTWIGGPPNTGGFSNPMPNTPNIPVTMIDFAVEGWADQGWIAPAVSNMVTH